MYSFEHVYKEGQTLFYKCLSTIIIYTDIGVFNLAIYEMM